MGSITYNRYSQELRPSVAFAFRMGYLTRPGQIELEKRIKAYMDRPHWSDVPRLIRKSFRELREQMGSGVYEPSELVQDMAFIRSQENLWPVREQWWWAECFAPSIGLSFTDELALKVGTGEKTVTRRPVRPSKHFVFEPPDKGVELSEYGWPEAPHKATGCMVKLPARYGRPGQAFHVREAHRLELVGDGKMRVTYRADGAQRVVPVLGTKVGDPKRWRGGMHMPAQAARYWGRINSVRAGEVGGLHRDEIRAEGVWCWPATDDDDKFDGVSHELANAHWMKRWEAIYGPTHPERLVWVISFEVTHTDPAEGFDEVWQGELNQRAVA